MEVDLILVLDSDHEGRDVNNAAVDSDVSSLDEGSGVVDRVGQLGFDDAGLESSLQQFVVGHGQNVIETVLGFLIQQTELEHLTQQGGTFEESALILGIQSEKLSGSLSESGQDELDSPHLSLVLETELSANFNLLVVALFFERTAGLLGSLGV